MALKPLSRNSSFWDLKLRRLRMEARLKEKEREEEDSYVECGNVYVSDNIHINITHT